MEIIHRKMKLVNGKVQEEPLYRAYLRHYTKKLPHYIDNGDYYLGKLLVGLTTLVLGSICGFMLMAALPGFLFSGLIAVLLSFPVSLFYKAKRGEVHNAVPAFIVTIAFIALIVLCMGENIDSPVAFVVWLYDLNIISLQVAIEPFLSVVDDIWRFVEELCGGKAQNMELVLLAGDDWSRGVVIAYHLFLVIPILMTMFVSGFLLFKQQKTPHAKLMLVVGMLIPICWLIIAIKFVCKEAK